MRTDTIVAISTPPGVGGIAVLRLSGPDALYIAEKHLLLASQDSFFIPRRAVYCHFDNLDDVVAVFFHKGYTGEPTVEISCHGSLYIQQTILETLVADGARLALAGEFTQRAFLNGRLNLSQAEAVADLIDAVTPAQHRLAVSQLRGGYADCLRKLRTELVDLTSLLELELDFSQEDVEFADRNHLRELLSTLTTQVISLLESFKLGNAIKNGVKVAIVGPPNSGKSTLLNALLNDDRAIVSNIPGTTRDTIEETLVIGGTLFRLIDTAGLRHSDDPIEQQGIERSRRASQQADIVLVVADLTSNDAAVEQILQESRNHPCLLVLNKADLTVAPSYGQQADTVRISALSGQGIDALKQALYNKIDSRNHNDTLLCNLRHREALLHVQKALEQVQNGLDGGLPADLVAVDLRDALYHLGTITGEVSSDELLGNIFSRFCVGK